MIEHDLGVATHGKRHALFFAKQKYDTSIFFVVLLHRRVSEDFVYFHTFTVKYFEEGSARVRAHVRHFVELDST